MLTVWGRTNSVNVQKVMWAVAELGLEHERIDAGGQFGGLDTPAYGAMNPNRKIPTVRDADGTVVWESNACVRYLAARHGEGSLWPSDPSTRAAADAWMDWQLSTLQPDMTPIFWNLVRTPEPQRDMAAVRAAAERVARSWLILDEHLAGSRFVAGNELTMGDIPAGCLYWRYVNLDVAKPGLPNLEVWFRALKERDGYRHHVMLPVT
jgi:glutathione S-transferase